MKCSQHSLNSEGKEAKLEELLLFILIRASTHPSPSLKEMIKITTVRLSTPLRKYSNGKPEIDVEGDCTLRELVYKIKSNGNELKDKIIDENDELKRFVNIYLNNEDIRFLDGLNTKIKEKDNISILPAVSGG